MPNFKVEINGANFLIDMEGRTAKHGFLTIRFVEADDGAAAENAAVQMIRDTQRLRDLVRNAPDDPSVIDVTSIIETGVFRWDGEPGAGLRWYEKTPRSWWQFWRR